MRKITILGLLVLACLAVPCVQAFAGSPPSKGKWRQIERFGNGRVQSDLIYNNGVLVRKRIYDKEGHLLLDYRYKNGSPYSLRNFYENGRLKSVWTQRTREWRFYTRTGELKSVVKAGDSDAEKKYKSSYIF